ncbi:MAG: ferredoxin--NADP reductase [Pseudomonadota bacterium]
MTAAIQSAHPERTILAVRHHTETLFSFRVSRPAGFRFRAGEFVMLGLPGPEGRPILRAYSIASAPWEEFLEFYSIKVPDGPLTSRLSKVAPGDEILLKSKTTGTLVADALAPGGTLWLVATGTGFAPFASIIRDPDTYERFDHVVVTHTCRTAAELSYGEDMVRDTLAHPLFGEIAAGRLTAISAVTREPTAGLAGRITDLARSGALFDAARRPRWSPERDRIMVCGSTDMIKDLRADVEAAGFAEGSNAAPGTFVVEKAFVG